MSHQQEEVDWNSVAAIRSSHRRKKVFEAVAKKPRAATEIAEEVGMHRQTVSDTLRELKRWDPKLVECLTPDRPHHRIYGFTKEGKKVADAL